MQVLLAMGLLVFLHKRCWLKQKFHCERETNFTQRVLPYICMRIFVAIGICHRDNDKVQFIQEIMRCRIFDQLLHHVNCCHGCDPFSSMDTGFQEHYRSRTVKSTNFHSTNCTTFTAPAQCFSLTNITKVQRQVSQVAVDFRIRPEPVEISVAWSSLRFEPRQANFICSFLCSFTFKWSVCLVETKNVYFQVTEIVQSEKKWTVTSIATLQHWYHTLNKKSGFPAASD